jgi:beta-lactamase regulating signal transducer with metallopeptidase domain
LNWLWQGGAIALAATAIVTASKPSARVRYRIWAGALVLVVMTPIVGVLRPLLAAPAVPPGPAVTVALAQPSSAFLQLPDAWWTSTSIAIGVWAGWAFVHAGRLLSAIAALSRARRRCQPFPDAVESRLLIWERLRTTGRGTRLALSNGVQSAAVLGGPSPIVALSPALLHELSTDDVDCIVAHEWAHVQRRDDIVALAQGVVRAIAGWHPAVWWLDGRISAEREHACDEAVVQLTGSAKRYASCLVRAAGVSMQPVRPLPVVAMSAHGLRARVLRILSGGVATDAARRGTSLAAAAALSTLAVSIADIRLIEAASTESAPQAAAEPYVSGEPFSRAGNAPTTVAATASPTRAAQKMASPSEPRAVPLIRAAIPPRHNPASLSTQNPSPGGTPEPKTPESTKSPQEVAVRPLVPANSSMPGLREGLAAAGAPPPAVVAETPTPWGAAADAGIAIGHGSQKAAVATAGFFSRFGKKIASSF